MGHLPADAPTDGATMKTWPPFCYITLVKRILAFAALLICSGCQIASLQEPNIRPVGHAQPGAPRITYVWVHRYTTETGRDYRTEPAIVVLPNNTSNRHWDVIMQWSYKARSVTEL